MFLFRTIKLQITHKIILALSMELFNSILTFFTGFLGGIFSQKKDDKTNELQYITSERKEWRDTLRQIIPQLLNPPFDHIGYLNKTEIIKLETLKTQIQIRLNPFDDNDKEIIKNIENYIREIIEKKIDERKIRKKILEKEFASLLKHDWERVKSETKMKSFFTLFNLILIVMYLCFNCNEIYSLITICKCECNYPYLLNTISLILKNGVIYLAFVFVAMKFKNYFISCIEEKYKYNKFMSKIFKINYRKPE
jgi:hypothetical protein